MRLFFAICMDVSAAGAIADLQSALQRRARDPGIRWTPRAQLHYTLKFLGEVAEERVAGCCNAAREAVQSSAPFRLELAGVGAFPGHRSPRVLWVGAAAGGELLAPLAARLDAMLSLLGFEAEKRPFTPHLTIARVKGASAETAAARLLDAEQVGTLALTSIDRMVLMQSCLSPKGATYSVVETFPFPT
jgi:RNA 2',3'-cyclic 3'-phosphodiesterase